MVVGEINRRSIILHSDNIDGHSNCTWTFAWTRFTRSIDDIEVVLKTLRSSKWSGSEYPIPPQTIRNSTKLNPKITLQRITAFPVEIFPLVERRISANEMPFLRANDLQQMADSDQNSRDCSNPGLSLFEPLIPKVLYWSPEGVAGSMM